MVEAESMRRSYLKNVTERKRMCTQLVKTCECLSDGLRPAGSSQHPAPPEASLGAVSVGQQSPSGPPATLLHGGSGPHAAAHPPNSVALSRPRNGEGSTLQGSSRHGC